MDCSEYKDWKTSLVYLWMNAENENKSAYVRKIYMDLVSKMYAKNFSQQLGKWCEDHGVEYIGHVIEDNGEHNRLGCGAGHYFRAMSGPVSYTHLVRGLLTTGIAENGEKRYRSSAAYEMCIRDSV